MCCLDSKIWVSGREEEELQESIFREDQGVGSNLYTEWCLCLTLFETHACVNTLNPYYKPPKEGSIMTCILQMRKPRHRQIKLHAQRHGLLSRRAKSPNQYFLQNQPVTTIPHCLPLRHIRKNQTQSHLPQAQSFNDQKAVSLGGLRSV